MNTTENDITKTATTQAKQSKWTSWLKVGWVVNHIPFAIFLAVLAVVYIANGHYADKVIRDTGKAQNELKQLQYEFTTIKSDLMFKGKETEIVKSVEHMGLKPLQAPPVKLKLDSLMARSDK